jgi:hypothetical protein
MAKPQLVELEGSFFHQELLHPTELEPAIYTIKSHPRLGLGLTFASNTFSLPPKLYGGVSLADQIIESWVKLGLNNMGALFAGLPGTGKSIIAKKICNHAILNLGISVIVVSEPIEVLQLYNLITPYKTPFVLFFDEFEKVYYESQGEELLSLLDGSLTTPTLNLLTSNTSDISEFLIHRPGRIRYLQTYNSLHRDQVLDFLSDHLPENLVLPVADYLFCKTSVITFDILQAVATEIKIHQPGIEDLMDLLKPLNIKPESGFFTAVFSEFSNQPVIPFMGSVEGKLSRMQRYYIGSSVLRGEDIFVLNFSRNPDDPLAEKGTIYLDFSRSKTKLGDSKLHVPFFYEPIKKGIKQLPAGFACFTRELEDSSQGHT